MNSKVTGQRKSHHVPLRMCIICRVRSPKSLLRRFVRGQRQELIADDHQQMAGRGFYVCDGETKRESAISATVGARVVRVLQGGVLQVEGAREIRVNNETQIIVVRGLVRSTDINPDNTIPSTHMADATVEFYGMGVLADKQRPGWLIRILENVWPF